MRKTALKKAARKAKDSQDTQDNNRHPYRPLNLRSSCSPWSPSLACASAAELAANRIHREVGQKVHQTIRELGGTMPENLSLAENIKKVENSEKQRLKAEQNKALQKLEDKVE